MAENKEIISVGENQTLQFGNYALKEKAKQSLETHGDLYKVKSFQEITKLEKNEMFAYESVPGTKVSEYWESDGKLEFVVEGQMDTQIIVAVDEQSEYRLILDGTEVESFDSRINGKLVFSLELGEGKKTKVEVIRK